MTPCSRSSVDHTIIPPNPPIDIDPILLPLVETTERHIPALANVFPSLNNIHIKSPMAPRGLRCHHDTALYADWVSCLVDLSSYKIAHHRKKSPTPSNSFHSHSHGTRSLTVGSLTVCLFVPTMLILLHPVTYTIKDSSPYWIKMMSVPQTSHLCLLRNMANRLQLDPPFISLM